MALFGAKKNKKEAEGTKPALSVVKTMEPSLHSFDNASFLLRPRVTEKASMKVEEGVYVFEVASKANAGQVASAVKELYKVTPVKVNMVKIPKKQVFVRGKWGIKKGGKKAYVFLKKGDKIEVI